MAKLFKDDAKFFWVNISPSEKELIFLKYQFGEEGMKKYLKEYASEVMNSYAKNFKPESVASNSDIVYFGRLEEHCYYNYKDLEVRKGKAKKGEAKPGEQLHIQIIVSRKDATNSIKLSPLNNSKGKNQAHSQKVGQFDRVAFNQSAEQLFDDTFGYDRNVAESFDYANAMKNGSYEQKQEAKARLRLEQSNGGLHQSSQGKNILEILLENPDPKIASPVPDSLTGRRRKKRGLGYNGGYSM